MITASHLEQMVPPSRQPNFQRTVAEAPSPSPNELPAALFLTHMLELDNKDIQPFEKQIGIFGIVVVQVRV